MNDYTPYQQYIRESFSAAYRFIEKHKHARTADEWERVAEDAGECLKPLEMDLIVSCIKELEREYENSKGVQS